MFGWSHSRKRMERRLAAYLDHAGQLLPDEDMAHAREFLRHGEHALAIEHVIDRLGDREIQISGEFADETLKWCSEVGVTEGRQGSARKLIKPA